MTNEIKEASRVKWGDNHNYYTNGKSCESDNNGTDKSFTIFSEWKIDKHLIHLICRIILLFCWSGNTVLLGLRRILSSRQNSAWDPAEKVNSLPACMSLFLSGNTTYTSQFLELKKMPSLPAGRIIVAMLRAAPSFMVALFRVIPVNLHGTLLGRVLKGWGPIHMGCEHSILCTNPLMLLVSSVNTTPGSILPLCIQCGLGLDVFQTVL